MANFPISGQYSGERHALGGMPDPRGGSGSMPQSPYADLAPTSGRMPGLTNGATLPPNLTRDMAMQMMQHYRSGMPYRGLADLMNHHIRTNNGFNAPFMNYLRSWMGGF